MKKSKETPFGRVVALLLVLAIIPVLFTVTADKSSAATATFNWPLPFVS